MVSKVSNDKPQKNRLEIKNKAKSNWCLNLYLDAVVMCLLFWTIHERNVFFGTEYVNAFSEMQIAVFLWLAA